MKAIRLWSWLAVVAFIPAALGQDSSSKNLTCGVGDAVSPWDDGASLGGSEQCNDYIVDLVPFTSAWGDNFAIAPLIKSSKASSTFTGSLISSHAVSKDYLTAQPFASSTYDLWSAPGFGVNNDVTKNDPGTPIITADLEGDQFAAAFAEFATTDTAAEYNAIIGALVNRLPSEPLRLYVHRVVAAANSCNNASNVSQLGFGAVDANGNVVWRADNNNATLTGGCGLTNITGNSVLGASMAARDCDSRNVVSLEYLTDVGQSDPPAASTYVSASATTHNTPSMVPASENGGNPAYIGSTFGVAGNPGHFIHGQAGGVVNSGDAHLDPAVLDHRGNVSYSTDNFFTGSTHGTAGILARINSDCGDPGTLQCTDSINVWGLGANGAIAGTPRVLTLPRVGPDVIMTDACDGTTNIAGKNEFGNYRSQAAFRGGNGQVAVGVDQDGRLLAAAMVNHPTDTTVADWPVNYMAVARIDSPADVTIEWTMAAWNIGGTGKEILDGPGGTPIGQLVSLDNVTGGEPFGPSMSSPMMDSVGNLYFISAIEVFDQPGASSGDYNNGLIRAVYDPATFCYQLDLMLTLGGTPNFGPSFYDPLAVHGQNSDRDWTVNFMGIADSNSVDSGTAFSGNISAAAHLGMDPALIEDTRDVQAMGGLVLSVEVTYDSDEDGDIDPCDNPFDPPSDDESYNVLLYISADPQPPVGPTCPGGDVADCADLDNDNKRDDPCLWYACTAGECSSGPRGFGNAGQYGQADIGSPVGPTLCGFDGVADGNDRFHALNCFANTNFGGAGAYPCEINTPNAMNTDAGSSASCVLDGVCDGNDAFHALNSFGNTNFGLGGPYPCACLPGPAPVGPTIQPKEFAGLVVRAPRSALPGELVDADVYIAGDIANLRGYQLHLGVSGGESGTLELVDIFVKAQRSDYAYADIPSVWSAFNRAAGQMVVGMDAVSGAPVQAGAYLATFVYRVPKDASGTFVVEVLHDEHRQSLTQRTFLFGEAAGPIGVSSATPALLTVRDRHDLKTRVGVRN